MTEKNKLGVALVKETCKLCGDEYDGPIIMNTVLTEGRAKKVEELHGKSVGLMKDPCDKCKDLMSQGFLLIGVIESKTTDPRDPYRNGQMWVVTHEYAKSMFKEEDLKKGAAFITTEVVERLGFPDVNNGE